MPLAYVRGGHGLLTYLGHYLVARGLFGALERLTGSDLFVPICVGLGILLLLRLFGRGRRSRRGY